MSLRVRSKQALDHRIGVLLIGREGVTHAGW
jgi:hypothetical protein